MVILCFHVTIYMIYPTHMVLIVFLQVLKNLKFVFSFENPTDTMKNIIKLKYTTFISLK